MSDKTQTSVAEEVRECRKALGLTLQDFADKLGVTLRAVQYWEAGTRKPGNAALTLMRRFKPRKAR